MEHLVRIMFFIVSWNMMLFVPLIFVVIGLFVLRKQFAASIRSARSDGRDVPLFGRIAHILVWLAIGLSSSILLFSFINILRPHAIDSGLIYGMGHFADAKVLNQEGTSSTHNDEPVSLFNVLYRTEKGEMIETYFYSTDFNIYPTANSVDYPEPGETFRVAYLPNFPDTFVILTEAESPYIKNNRCGDLRVELQKAINRREFEPDNEQYAQQLADAAKRFADAGCS